MSVGNCWIEAENGMKSLTAAAQAKYYEWGMCEKRCWNMYSGEDNHMDQHGVPVAWL